jgi:hypothetical protein
MCGWLPGHDMPDHDQDDREPLGAFDIGKKVRSACGGLAGLRR